MQVEVSWSKNISKVKNVGVAIIKNSGEYIFGANTLEKPPELKHSTITYDVMLSLGPGKYYLMAGLFGKTKYDQISFQEHGPQFIVEADPLDTEHGTARLQNSWVEKNDR
jgi:hypothetical protein